MQFRYQGGWWGQQVYQPQADSIGFTTMIQSASVCFCTSGYGSGSCAGADGGLLPGTELCELCAVFVTFRNGRTTAWLHIRSSSLHVPKQRGKPTGGWDLWEARRGDLFRGCQDHGQCSRCSPYSLLTLGAEMCWETSFGAAMGMHGAATMCESLLRLVLQRHSFRSSRVRTASLSGGF